MWLCQAVFDGGSQRNRGAQRDFGRLAKVVLKPLDKAQRICDTTARETSKRKNIKRLSPGRMKVLSTQYLDN
ncbi:hypothetical protein KDAU_12340 [Dictyobacter aurantiacus]|uniref:Uncharacterized protein n=1 Tax=Dictyobacter aurantiacus TaxID=1936993 RepID=A0A401ZAM7_9CHLR|nr:hypothetical protein KDAU_12340 [Dictyobacter aurantiacus]